MELLVLKNKSIGAQAGLSTWYLHQPQDALFHQGFCFRNLSLQCTNTSQTGRQFIMGGLVIHPTNMVQYHLYVLLSRHFCSVKVRAVDQKSTCF